ncbi:hypothetical protein [Zobellella sp. An-6]|uniref:hypothetical protein n=1 Tax=Zobellella sp. An-6 TaxID=3400218 RepID=UPI004042EA5C
MPDPSGLTWAATLVSLAVAVPTAGHAVIYKRDPRSATLWVLLIALLPLAGLAHLVERAIDKRYSVALASYIFDSQAIRDIVMDVFDRAYRILEINREVLERCARELLARETLDEYSIRQLTQGLQLESPCHSGPAAGAITSSVSQGATS